ncbi:MAG: sodium ion-translocating decarboxylase subunit beta [Oscillospiraceae bacterium]|nr:sodium ion-translocating decarboxylase subunit beta [Oscillospiraceae bacterium]
MTQDAGFAQSFLESVGFIELTVPDMIMIMIAFALIWLAVIKKYEPFLLLPLAFGMMVANMPLSNLSAYDEGGLLYFLYQGIAMGIYPPMIFLCIGAMTDFGPLMASPKSAFIGLGGQLGILMAFAGAIFLGGALSGVVPGFPGFTLQEAASIAIIGSSDGPTAIFITDRLASELLPVIAIAAYSYMSLVPLIQPPIMRVLTTPKERVIVMPPPKAISRQTKIIFPIAMTVGILLIVPAAGPLMSMLMLGNLIRESGATDRVARMLQGDLLYFLTLLIGFSVGATATAERVLNFRTVFVILLGLFAFSMGTVGGVLVAKLLCKLTNGQINPLIGNAGVSAMPMAARVSQKVGQEFNPSNHLLMHAMAPIVSSTIGSALLAGIFIALLG